VADPTLTEDQLQDLRDNANSDGDQELVALCIIALGHYHTLTMRTFEREALRENWKYLHANPYTLDSIAIASAECARRYEEATRG
jgi:hypothetical protein